jgi:acyl transferase domain-containing protein
MADTQLRDAPTGGGVFVWDVRNERPRRAGTGPETATPHDASPAMADPLLYTVSATSAEELRNTARRLAEWAGDHADDVAPSDLAYTLARRRSHRPVRTAVVAASLAEVATKLRDVADGDTPYLPAVGQDDRGPVWVFSGQESWYTKPGARCARGTKLRRRGRN